MEHERLTNQARFVHMIVKKELSVSGRKKADIVVELRKKGFRPFPKVAKAKAAGEEEEVVGADPEEEEAATGASSDYDYLLGMAIWSLTHEKVRVIQSASLYLVLTSVVRSRNCSSKVGKRKRSYWRYLSCLLSNFGTRT